MTDSEFDMEMELLRQRDEAYREQRVRRYLDVNRKGVIAKHHFSEASTECLGLFRDGYFIATVMMTQAVNEGILKFVADRNGLSYSKTKDLVNLKTSPLLKILPYDCVEASRKIFNSRRDDFHHMNPPVSEQDIEKLANENIRRLALVEHEVFAVSVAKGQPGQLVLKYASHWNVSKDGLTEVVLRNPTTDSF